MSSVQVLLVLLSGLGVLHGLLLAIFLWFYPKGNHTSNKLLSLLLLILSFRVGKSVILEFADGVYLTLIFIGLATLLLIGPLFYFYTKAVLDKSFRLVRSFFLHVIPAIPAFAFSLWINEVNVKTTPQYVFIMLFSIYYGHYLFYLLLSYRLISKAKKDKDKNRPALEWLTIMFFALAAIWVVYVLNLVEDNIPYILGPILYSVIAYGISFMAIKNGYISLLEDTKYKTTPLSAEEAEMIAEKLKALIINDKLYKDPDLSLDTLGKLLKVSPQKISLVINTRFRSNFNSFVNHHRIKQAEVLMRDEAFNNYTIAFIAYEIGFNSLTSFNTAFKKEMQKTPSAFRKEITSGQIYS